MPISFLLSVPIVFREPLKSQPKVYAAWTSTTEYVLSMILLGSTTHLSIMADGYVIETYTLTGTHDLAGLYGSSPLNHPYL